MNTTDDDSGNGPWRALLRHPEIDRLFDAYLGENADLLLAGQSAPPLQDYLIASGMTNVPSAKVTHADATADHDADCQLVRHTSTGNHFWFCPW